jgi:hypothetical protein
LYNTFARPVIARTFGSTPEDWAEGAVYLAANPSYRPATSGLAGYFGSTLKTVPASTFAQKKGNCEAIFERMAKMING